jgi:Flp pilus assembly protein TadG
MTYFPSRLPFLRRLRRFAGDTQGNIALETLIWMPFILFLLVATFSLHDAFRYKSMNVKAAYTISDALSRETDPIDSAYLDGMVELLDFLTRPGGASSLRVTLVRYDASCHIPAGSMAVS